MKKLSLAILILLLAVLISGCKEQEKTDTLKNNIEKYIRVAYTSNDTDVLEKEYIRSQTDTFTEDAAFKIFKSRKAKENINCSVEAVKGVSEYQSEKEEQYLVRVYLYNASSKESTVETLILSLENNKVSRIREIKEFD